MAGGQALDAAGRVELRPFGAQGRDGVALAAQFAGELRDALGLQRGIELDLVDEGRRQDERADDENVEKAHAQCPFTTSASAGRRGSRSDTSSARAGASLRSAARSLAERARGLCATSSASATTGRLVSSLNVGAGRINSGAGREPARVSPEPAKNVLTLRSSSEWNATATRRPLGLRMRSAAVSASTSSPSSSLTKMRSAWKVRVAGWISPGRKRTTEPTISASMAVVRIGAWARGLTMAPATLREWRSSPKMKMILARSRSQ